MKISVMTIGNEIITGDILDSNSQFLCSKLVNKGHTIENVVSVGDLQNSIVNATKYLLSTSEVIIVTGGLGPTQDDITVESIAHALKREIEFDQDILDGIEARFKKMNRVMSENNKSQAYKIKGSRVIENDYGTACGSVVEFENKKIYILPGPPYELKMMFNKIEDEFNSDQVIKSILFRCISIGESALETKIADLIGSDIEYGIYANKQFVDIKITAMSNDEKVVDNTLTKYEKLISDRISEYVYSNDKDIVSTIIDNLRKRNEKISLAESCTGGMLTSMFVDVSGVSDVLVEGLVTYSDESKISRLGVYPNFIAELSAVSLEVCNSMILNQKGDLNVAITGYADGEKSGLVYIGVYYNGEAKVRELNLEGDRNTVRTRACYDALELIYHCMK